MGEKASFFQNKGLGFFLALPVAICAAAAALLYQKTGVTEFSPVLNTAATAAAWAAAAVSLLSLFLDWKAVKYISYLLILYSFTQYISSQATYIVNVFVSIDGTSFSSGMVATATAYALAIILGLAAAITAHWQPWKKGGDIQ
jgi:hypothetical protein